MSAVTEVTRHYEIDGVQFDDYFYPVLNDDTSSTWFDKPEYGSSGFGKTITQWRRDNVSTLVSRVNKEINSIRPDITFGISPQGSLDNLRSHKQIFVDIDKWLASDQYIDYVMPQLYWGFEAKYSDGTPAPYAFENNLKLWTDLTAKGPVDLYLGLGLYKGAAV